MGKRGRAWEDFKGRGMSEMPRAVWNPEQCCFAGFICLSPFSIPIPTAYVQTSISKSSLPTMRPAMQ